MPVALEEEEEDDDRLGQRRSMLSPMCALSVRWERCGIDLKSLLLGAHSSAASLFAIAGCADALESAVNATQCCSRSSVSVVASGDVIVVAVET